MPSYLDDVEALRSDRAYRMALWGLRTQILAGIVLLAAAALFQPYLVVPAIVLVVVGAMMRVPLRRAIKYDLRLPVGYVWQALRHDIFRF